MAIDYNKLRGILERKANKAIGYLDELKCFVPEFREVLDSVLYISETLKDLTFLDTECPDCKKEEPQRPQPEPRRESMAGKEYRSFLNSTPESDYVVLFYSDGCEPCQLMKPVVEEVVSELGVVLEKVSVDDDTGVAHAENYKVKGWPQIFVIKDNKIVYQIAGYNMQQPREEIKEDLTNAVKHFLEL